MATNEQLARRVAEHYDINTIEEMAKQRIAELGDYSGSTDGMDYAYAAAQVYAEIMTIVHANWGGDPTEDLIAWLATDPMEWHATDGDIRFDLAPEGLVEEWDAHIEQAWS